MEYAKQRDEWVEKNPLRRFRKANKLILIDIPIFSYTMLYRWEHGMYELPLDEGKLTQLSEALRYPTLVGDWRKWEKSKPKGGDSLL